MIKNKNRILLSLMLCVSVMLFGCKSVSEEPAIPVNITVEDFEAGKDAEVPPSVTEPPTTTVTEPPVITQKPPEFANISFLAVGDNLIHSSIYKQAQARDNDDGYDFTFAYENVADIISKADVAVINQETLICNDIYAPSTYPRFNSPIALGNHMLDIGFDVFTIANNHTLDKNEDGLKACLDYWDTKDNATVAGAYRNAQDRDNIRTNEINGVTFSYLSYTEHLNGLSLPSDSEMIIGDAFNIDLMVSEIKKASEISDVCVVALHWGVENSDIISDYQRETAKKLAEAGADIIIGNHPHVLRDIELIDREDGSQAICAYSLGNFISAQSVGQNLIGGILQFDVMVLLDDAPARDKQPVFSNIKLVPIVTHYEYGYANVKIYKFSDYTAELASAHGVRSNSKFSYDYIKSVLENTINEKFLVI